MLDTPDQPLMDVVDFDLTRHLAPRHFDENLFLAATRALQQSRQHLFELLRDAPTIDIGQSRDERDRQWQAWWNGRARHTAVARHTDAAGHFRRHYQAACALAFAEGRVSSEQLPDLHHTRQASIPHGRVASGS
ncbi:hypothetical protein [Pseudomonas bharatica]